MSKRLMKFSTVALTIAMAFPALAQTTPSPETVVATVNGTDITLGHVILVRSTLPEQYNQLSNDVLFNGIVDQLVQQTLLSQDESATETLRVRLAVENERRALLATEVVEKMLSTAVSDEALKAAYDAQFASVELGVEYNASHILVETQEEAQAIAEEIRAGADFAQVAMEKSTGPSGPSGGSLGWFGPGMMVQPFQDAVETLEIGAVSDPVETQFGWHVIILNETRQKDAPAFDEVKDQLAQEVQQASLRDYVDGLMLKADISRTALTDIDPASINNLQLLEE